MMDELRAGYCDLPDVVQHLDAVERDIKENADDFLPPAQPPEGMPIPAAVEEAITEARFRRYQVNVIVDNGGQHGAPVIYEDNPTHQTLVGRVEYMARFGTLVTDFNLLTPGALHRANGGYLMLDAQRLLAGNFGWASLKRALNAGEIRIETLEQLLSMASTVSLQPEPIPLDVKVVLLGPPLLYYLLSALDDDFKELFKIAADFDDRVERTPETTLLYARFIAGVVRREKLLPFDRSAVARVIEQAARLVGDADRLSDRAARDRRSAAGGRPAGRRRRQGGRHGGRGAAGDRCAIPPRRPDLSASAGGDRPQDDPHRDRRRRDRPGQRAVGDHARRSVLRQSRAALPPGSGSAAARSSTSSARSSSAARCIRRGC